VACTLTPLSEFWVCNSACVTTNLAQHLRVWAGDRRRVPSTVPQESLSSFLGPVPTWVCWTKPLCACSGWIQPNGIMLNCPPTILQPCPTSSVSSFLLLFCLPSHESRWPCVPPAFHNRMVQTDLLLRNYLVGEQCLNDPAPSTQTVCRKEFQGDREKNTTVVIKLQNSLYPLPIACICVIPPSKLC
jgi:hypothetical protein